MQMIPCNIIGMIKIFDPETNEVFVEKTNSIHYENMSEALALSIANKETGRIHEMHFGNGGSSVDTTGIITYLPTNSTGQNADLYNRTYCILFVRLRRACRPRSV